jgi:hypothetical protein
MRNNKIMAREQQWRSPHHSSFIPSKYFRIGAQFDVSRHLSLSWAIWNNDWQHITYFFLFISAVCGNFNTFYRKERALTIMHRVSLFGMVHIPCINQVNTIYFFAIATTCPLWLWPKCNRLLRLGRPWGAVTLSRWGGWWYMNMR